jgi:hypothetical protein
MSTPCPDEVVAVGRSLIKARKSASIMSEQIDAAIVDLHTAIDVMTSKHGAKAMQAGIALSKLRQAQAALGDIMQAHDSLRHVLVELDIEQPTDAQVASIR